MGIPATSSICGDKVRPIVRDHGLWTVSECVCRLAFDANVIIVFIYGLHISVNTFRLDDYRGVEVKSKVHSRIP